MLRDLRFKFVALNMVLAALVLVVAFSTVCYLDYRTRIDTVYSSLNDALQYATASLYDSHSSNVITGPVPLTLNLTTVELSQIGALEMDDSAGQGESASGSASASANGNASDGSGAAAENLSRNPNSPEIAAELQAQKQQEQQATGSSGSAEGTANAQDAAQAADESSATAQEPADEGASAAADDSSRHPEIGGADAHESLVTPMAVYVISPEGRVSVLDQLTSASIAEDVRMQAINDAMQSPDDTGLLSDAGLYYAKRTAFGNLCIAFADAGAASSWQGLAWMLVGIGACTLVAFLGISIFFSRWAFKPVEAAWKTQQQFTADASHELKTPLTVILANMQILQSHPEETIASQSQWIESTQTEGESMRQMINDMLDLARPESMRTPKVLSDIDLTDLLEGDALQFESVAFERGITLDMDLQQGVRIKGDPMRLHRLTSTLIDNACKYANEGGTVDVRLTSDARDIKLTVHNSGSVIAPEDLPHVFDRFYRADKARSRESGSYGLGLAIARDVAREHDGDITVTSAEGEGTTFTATLSKKAS